MSDAEKNTMDVNLEPKEENAASQKKTMDVNLEPKEENDASQKNTMDVNLEPKEENAASIKESLNVNSGSNSNSDHGYDDDDLASDSDSYTSSMLLEEFIDNMKNDNKKVGFDRGLEPSHILTATKIKGEIYFLMAWKGVSVDDNDMVASTEVYRECPQIAIQFYESRVQLCSRNSPPNTPTTATDEAQETEEP